MAGFSLDALQERNSKFTEKATTKRGKGMEQCVTLIFLKKDNILKITKPVFSYHYFFTDQSTILKFPQEELKLHNKLHSHFFASQTTGSFSDRRDKSA